VAKRLRANMHWLRSLSWPVLGRCRTSANADSECTWARNHRWHVEESTCAGEIIEREGNRYCALHLPYQDKQEAFRRALTEKRAAGKYDFRGAWFPTYVRAKDLVSPSQRHNGGNGRSRFVKKVSFAHAVFSDGANFSNTDFVDDANFSEAEFSGRADFRKATFEKKAHFFGTKFAQREPHYDANVEFAEATFIGKSDFSDCEFFVKVNFSEASFETDVDFGGAQFEQEADFSEVAFSEAVRFVGRLQNKVFHGPQVVFRGTQIVKPEQFYFHSVKLRPAWLVGAHNVRAVNLANVEWFGWPMEDGKKLQEEISKTHQLGTAPRATLIADTCRELALNYEASRQYPEAGRFYYGSMDAAQDTMPRYRRPFSLRFWYWALSGYSERPGLTLFWLAVVFAGFTLLYTVIDLPGEGPDGQCALLLSGQEQPATERSKDQDPLLGGCAGEVGQAAVYGLGGIVRQVSAVLRQAPDPGAQVGLLQFLLIVQGILGILLIALFALAVRRRFLR
jgi:uncharacterized protein YjbI with pentapeptide repeats